jgi:hypothetical protein
VTVELLLTFVTAGLKEDEHVAVGRPSANGVAGDLGEEKRVVEPDGTFGPGEARSYFFELSVWWNDSIGRRIEPRHLKGCRSEHSSVCERLIGLCGCVKRSKDENSRTSHYDEKKQSSNLHDGGSLSVETFVYAQVGFVIRISR